VNVHVSRLEAAAIGKIVESLPDEKRDAVWERVSDAVSRYGLDPEGDSYSKTFSCPLFEPGPGASCTRQPSRCRVSHMPVTKMRRICRLMNFWLNVKERWTI
jgi:hypothetical protein